MKTRPKALTALSALLFLVACGIPIQIMFLFEHPPWEVVAIATKITPLNGVVMMLCFICSYLIYHASPWTNYFVGLLLISVSWNNWLVANIELNYSAFAAGLATLGLFLAHLPLLTPQIRVLLDHPEKRWWRTARRVRVAQTISLTSNNTAWTGQTFDLSRGGAFVTHSSVEPRMAFSRDEVFKAKLQLDPKRVIECQAQIVRESDAKGTYPKGVGLQFSGMSFRDRLWLLSYLNGVQKEQLALTL